MSGRLAYVDGRTKRVSVKRDNGKELILDYDELILALFLEPNLDLVPGMMTHAETINSVGDALHIRKRILHMVEEAEIVEDVAERRRLLTFGVVGSGQRSCATAVEICEMLGTAEVCYPVLREHGWQVYQYEDTKVPFTDFEAKIKLKRDHQLKKAGVTLCGNDETSLWRAVNVAR